MSEKGFGVIEIIIVVALIAIIIAIGLPLYWNYLDNRQLNSAVSQVEADLRQAQQKAKATNCAYEVLFIPSETVYRIYEHPADGLAQLIETKSLPGQVQIHANTAPANKIKYYPAFAQSETDGGEITFRSARGNLMKIVVATITGRIRTEQ